MDLWIQGILSIKDDLSKPMLGAAAWTPLRQAAGQICEQCWLHTPQPGVHSSWMDHDVDSSWMDHDVDVIGVDEPECPHGTYAAHLVIGAQLAIGDPS